MSDRRRINGPAAPTTPPVFLPSQTLPARRVRPHNAIRPMYLKTGVTPTASGSAFLELALPSTQHSQNTNGMKLICTVHGPRALPRSAPFSHHLVLSTHVKFAPFATQQRRGYLRDASEQDLSVHLETALRGAIIADRWPKSGVDVIVTILEGDEPPEVRQTQGAGEWYMMNVLSACITVASAAIADAGIDCVDSVTGGVAALVPVERPQEGDNNSASGSSKSSEETEIVLDPVPSEHDDILAACCVAYLPARDEITNLWVKGKMAAPGSLTHMKLIGSAVQVSKGTHKTLCESLLEAIS